VDTNTDDDVQVQVQPIEGTISVGTLTDSDVQVQVQPTVGSIQIGNLQLPVRDRWQQTPLVYSRREPQVPQVHDSYDTCLVYSWRQPLVQKQQQVQGEHQGSGASSSDTVELPIALRKGTREAAQKALPPEVFDDHDIGNFVSYEALSPSYRAFVASLQTVSIPKD